jgi:valyl-tRNA synthetase
MDENCSKAVNVVFKRLYDEGLIYRGERIINWCPTCLTSISDAEVEYEEQDGHFWHLRYPLADGSGFMELATTRPETMLGDTALAVHPDDERYKHLVGKTVILPLVNREIPVVADEYVEMDFGTGVVKITPAHDPNDFEVGLRHDLPIINVMNEDATINENGGKYVGMSRQDCRKAIVADLEAGGFLVKVEDHKHNVGECYRCSTTVEPRVSLQWFVKMEPLAKPAIEVVREGKTKFVPERFGKIYFHWMENIKDWCISRQLWWGHQIPAWYCKDCGEVIVARTAPDACSKCGSKNLRQDEDTLDTWFSSALWPFSTLGWPDETPELKYFYPTDTLVTAYDIIFFWVARMIFSGVEQMDVTPFSTVYMHGLVRDAQGRKMSKSLGNGIDPLDVIDEFGADALRYTIINGIAPGSDVRFTDEKVKSSRNFANKIWNAVRYVLMNLDESIDYKGLPDTLAVEDKWVVSRFNTLAAEVTDNLENFDLGVAAGKLYDFLWDTVCDWYIELTKTRIQQGGDSAASAQKVLVWLLDGTLRLLHPFMPFLTEELWQAIPHEGESLMIADWPKYDPARSFTEEEAAFTKVMEAIRAIRARRAEMNVPPSKKAKVYIASKDATVFDEGAAFIQRLAYASEVETGENFQIDGAVQVVTDSARILIPMEDLIDLDKERARLQNEVDKAEQEIAMLEKKLGNEGFVAKAPAQVIEAERAKLAGAKERLTKTKESLAAIS